MIRIVVLGANGQLGTDLGKVFANESDMEWIPILRKDLDVSNIGAIAPFLRNLNKFDVLINCTSYHKTDDCEEHAERAFIINSLAPWEMAKYCAGVGHLPLFIHFTTDYVFGGNQSVPYSESSSTQPLNVYGASKASGEQLIQAYGKRYLIFRVSSLFGVAGASGKGGNFVETMIRLARDGKEITVVNDQFMSPTHTLDIARAVASMLRNKSTESGIYHCSGEGACSWYEFAKEIFRRMNIDANLSPCSASSMITKAKRPSYSVLDNRKINAIHQMPDWKAALDEYIRLKHEEGKQ